MYREKWWQNKGEIQQADTQNQKEGMDLASYEKEVAALENHETWLNSHRLIDVQEELRPSEELCEAIYFAYAKAISRRERQPLEKARFDTHFFNGGNKEGSVAFGDKHRGYLLGSKDSMWNIFTPTHFAPFSMRSGYELLAELGESAEIPAILAITDDLEQTLSKLPSWHTLDLPDHHVAGFHTGELLSKRLMYNDYFMSPEGQHLAMQALAAYLFTEPSDV